MRIRHAVFFAAALAAQLSNRSAQAAPRFSLTSLDAPSSWEREADSHPLACAGLEKLGFCALRAGIPREPLAGSPLGLRIVPAQVDLPAFMRLAQAFISSLKVGEVGAWRIKLHLELR